VKILIIQEAGRHFKNKNFRESLCLKRAFDFFSNLHQTDVWGFGYDNFNEKLNFNEYDILINLENYDTGWVPDLAKINRPIKFLWSIDSHVKGIESYLQEYKRGKYNYVLQATLDFVSKIPNSIWFPNCYDNSLIYPKRTNKSIDVGFCGNYGTQQRKEILDFLSKRINLKQDIFVIGNEMVDIINNYKIHFNLNIANDINYRNFETIGCNTILCTNNNDQYKKLGFIDLENCLIYNSIQEAIEKINFVLNDKNTYEKIQSNGFKLSARHNYKKRSLELLQFLNENIHSWS